MPRISRTSSLPCLKLTQKGHIKLRDVSLQLQSSIIAKGIFSRNERPAGKGFADKLGKTLERSGKRCVVLHGGKQQDQREASLEQFKGGGCVLIATDVAGRGIDIPDVSFVINYDLPQKSIDPYCHRIGRTGRAGKSGVAYSFVTDGDTEIAPKLLQYLKQTNAFIPDDWARKVGKAGRDMENIE